MPKTHGEIFTASMVAPRGDAVVDCSLLASIVTGEMTRTRGLWSRQGGTTWGGPSEEVPIAARMELVREERLCGGASTCCSWLSKEKKTKWELEVDQ
ncbi:hypothetical protein Lalb_Chr16g0385361 [Lupinus albus]|uniref:Uncharacterized protein n=1 Tax=Lupinus albus TaxID=3870 RepID=A0A6A4NUL7_LUPAL|nr:hypothetical protein Lalb_Chr16g0385361 [Lupinus albus]